MLDGDVYAQNVGEIIQHGIKREQLTNVNYRNLLEIFESDKEFRSRVFNTAKGMGIRVHDESSLSHGLLLSADRNGPFSYSVGQFSSKLKWDEKLIDRDLLVRRAAMVLVNVAISSAFFPTAESLESADTINQRAISYETVLKILVELSDSVLKTETDILDPNYLSAAKALEEMPKARPDISINTLGSLKEMIEAVLRLYAENRLIRVIDRDADTKQYFPTYLYMVQLRARSYSIVTEMRALLENSTEMQEKE